MSAGVIIGMGVAFVAAGAAFCGIALFLGRPESVQKAPISKPSSTIFYIMGTVTLVLGVLALAFHRHVTRGAVQAAALAYLAALTVLFFIFATLIKEPGKK